MSAHEEAPDDDDDDASASGILPVAKRCPTPLDSALLRFPVSVRVDEMLARHHEGDHLGALLLSESILWDAPGNGLACVCHAESAAHMRRFLLSKPPRMKHSGEMDAFARLLVMSFDGTRTILSLLPTGSERANALRAVHDLVRIGFLATD